MIKAVILLNRLIDVLGAIVVIVFNILFSMDLVSFYISFGIIVGLTIFDLVFILFMEAMIKEYQAKRFTLFLFITIAVVSVALYYIVRNVDYYWFYNLILDLLTVFIATLFIVLNYKLKPKKTDKPRFIVNK